MAAKKKNGDRRGRRIGAGRRPKAAPERLDYPVQFNVTRDEIRALYEAAGEESLAAYVRRLVLRHLARRRK